MLELLIDLGWKSVLVSGLALLVGHGVRGLSASERVMVLRAGIAGLLMLPLFALAMPVLELAVLPVQHAVPAIDSSPMGGPEAREPSASPVGLMPWLYGAGAALVLLRLVAGLLALHRWTRTAVPSVEVRWTGALANAAAPLRRPVRLLVSPHVPGPLSWGIASAWLLIDPAAEKNPQQAEAVIAHEMAHVRRFDWPVLMASRIATALYWFNPLVWLLARALAHQTELAADDDAVRSIAQADYAQTLLTVASPAVPAVACGMTVSKSMLASRIRRVLETGPHRPASRLLGPALLVCVPGAAAPLAAMQLVPAMEPPAVETDHAASSPAALPPQRLLDQPAPPEAASAASRARVVAPAPPLVAIANRPASAFRDWGAEGRRAAGEARRNAAEIRAAAEARAGKGDVAANAAPVRAEEAQRGPEMDEKRAIALGLSDSANEIRAEAARIEADINERDVSRKIREGTLAGARAMRKEADRLDRKARRLVFGR